MAEAKGKTVVGMSLEPGCCRLLVTRRGAGQGQAVCRAWELDWRQAETQPAPEMLASARAFLGQQGAQGAPVFLALPADSVSLHPWPAPGGATPPLERLSPLPPEQLAWAWRALPGKRQGRQVALLPQTLLGGLWSLAEQLGLRPAQADLLAGYAALAAAELAPQPRPALALHLTPAEASWALLTASGPGQMGVLPRKEAETPGQLARRAAQQAVHVCGLESALPIWCWGPLADQAMAQTELDADPDAGDMFFAWQPLPAPPAPPSLEAQDLPLLWFLEQARPRSPLLGLGPRSGGQQGWLSSPRTSRRLAWGALALAAGLALGVGLALWWDYGQARGQLGQTQAQAGELRAQRQALAQDPSLAGQALKAVQARQQGARLLDELALRLPPAAWLESLQCQGNTCALVVAGAGGEELGEALGQSGLWRLAAPPAQAGARPGAGALWRVELRLEAEARP